MALTVHQELLRIKERLDKMEEVVDGMKEKLRSWKLRLEFVEGSLQARFKMSLKIVFRTNPRWCTT